MWNDSHYSCQISYQWTFLSLLFSVSAETPRANLQPASYTLWMPSRNFANESGALLSSFHYRQRHFSTEYDGEINNHLLLSKFISFLFREGASSAAITFQKGWAISKNVTHITKWDCRWSDLDIVCMDLDYLCFPGFQIERCHFFLIHETEMSTSPESYWIDILWYIHISRHSHSFQRP